VNKPNHNLQLFPKAERLPARNPRGFQPAGDIAPKPKSVAPRSICFVILYRRQQMLQFAEDYERKAKQAEAFDVVENKKQHEVGTERLEDHR
jgi:hypothetical protein